MDGDNAVIKMLAKIIYMLAEENDMLEKRIEELQNQNDKLRLDKLYGENPYQD